MVFKNFFGEEGGGGQREWTFMEKILQGIARKDFLLGGRVFYVGGTVNGGVFFVGREIFMKSEPELPALFEKRSKIKYKQELRAHMALVTRSKNQEPRTHMV